MAEEASALALAIDLVISQDADLFEIIVLSLKVSLSAAFFACIIGFSLGALIATNRFLGRPILIVVINALMGLPPVVVGLIVYLYLSRSGPLGFLGLLYTPTAMIIAQTLLITPIITALSKQLLEDMYSEYEEQFRAFGLTRRQTVSALLWDARLSLITVALAGFGRAVAEVGAVMIVGGNIDHLTRVMTTAIALETSKGNLALAMALGLVLMSISLAINALAQSLRLTQARSSYA